MDDNKPLDTTQNKEDKSKAEETKFDYFFSEDGVDSMVSLMDTLKSVDLNSKDAGKNASSISDNNGGRIELDGDGNIIKK